MHGVYDHARPVRALANARPPVLPSPLTHRVGASDAYSFAAQYSARMYPCQRFAYTLAEARRMTRGRCGWLALHRTALPSATPRRRPDARVILFFKRHGSLSVFGSDIVRNGSRRKLGKQSTMTPLLKTIDTAPNLIEFGHANAGEGVHRRQTWP